MACSMMKDACCLARPPVGLLRHRHGQPCELYISTFNIFRTSQLSSQGSSYNITAAESLENYVYSPLGPGQVRLLRILPQSTPENICCSIEHRTFKQYWNFEDLDARMRHTTDAAEGQYADMDHVLAKVHNSADDVDYYTALSYCWGDAAKSTYIMLDGKRFKVGENLASLLEQEVRKPNITSDHPWLWIDAVCLNQGDKVEKSIQVQQMWRVYECAAAVAIWLGPAGEHTATAFNALNCRGTSLFHTMPEARTYRSFMKGGLASSKLTPEAMKAIFKLAHNQYWSRLWIVPEVLAKAAIARHRLYSGPHTAPLATCNVTFRALDGPPPRVKPPSTAFMVLHYYGLNAATSDKYLPGSVKDFWSQASHDWKNNLCFNFRDKLFAMLSLRQWTDNTDWVPLEVDYSLTRYELAAAFMAHLDVNTSDPAVEYYVSGVHAGVYFLLDVQLRDKEFVGWLRSRVVRDEAHGTCYIETESGKRIDCTGFLIQQVLRYTEAELYP